MQKSIIQRSKNSYCDCDNITFYMLEKKLWNKSADEDINKFSEYRFQPKLFSFSSKYYPAIALLQEKVWGYLIPSFIGHPHSRFIYNHALRPSVTARNGNDDLFLALSRFCFIASNLIP
jgi:hypothetical protein